MIERKKILDMCYDYNPISIYYHFNDGTYRDSFIKLRQNGLINYLDL